MRGSRGLRSRAFAKLSAADLVNELRRRRRVVAGLQRARGRHLSAAARLEREIVRFGGTPNGDIRIVRRTPARNDSTLVEALAAALAGKAMTTGEAREAVTRAGYRTASRYFNTQVSRALSRSGRFRRVGRGRYITKWGRLARHGCVRPFRLWP